MSKFEVNQIFEGKYPPDAAIWCGKNNAYIEKLSPGKFIIKAIPEPTLEERINLAYKELDKKVEQRLDAFAATRRYNSIYTAKAAKDSHIEKYAIEGQYCELMWGETYAKCDELLAEYIPLILAGEREIPTWEEIEPQLPELKWPDEQSVETGEVNNGTA